MKDNKDWYNGYTSAMAEAVEIAIIRDNCPDVALSLLKKNKNKVTIGILLKLRRNKILFPVIVTMVRQLDENLYKKYKKNLKLYK